MQENPDVKSIVRRVLSGDKEGFLWIVRSHALYIRSYIAAHVYHLDDIDDLAQDVFLAAYENLANYDQRCDIKIWLRGIAQNKIKHFCRTQVRRNVHLARFQEEVVNVIQDDLATLASDETNQSIEALLRCIAKLPGNLRQVVHAGLDGLKSAALAEEMSTTLAGIYNLRYRANKLLRDCVEKEISYGT